MKSRTRLTFGIFILIGIVMTGFFNVKAIRDFIYGRDPNERTIRALTSKTSDGREQQATFSVPIGYGSNRSPGADHIALWVMYPSKAFVPSEPRGANTNEVYVLIEAGVGRTMGDNIKVEIDNHTLETSRFRAKVVREEGGSYVLKKITNRPSSRDDDEVLFYDSKRKHWVLSRLAQNTLHVGEGIIQSQTAKVHYTYRSALQPDHTAMHQWVMTLVEDLQMTSTPTQTKGK